MMEVAEFSTTNTALDTPEVVKISDEQTPATPKPTIVTTPEPVTDATVEDSLTSTPTRYSFAGVLGQLPLPDDPFTPSQQADHLGDATPSLKRDASTRSSISQAADGAQDVEMGEGEDDDGGEDEDGSDNDSVNSDSQRPSKKKKGQRFFCTDFPPCQLSFTRSEHLARHIRYVCRMRWQDRELTKM